MRHHVIRYDFNTSSANKYIEVNTAQCRKVTRDPTVDPQHHRHAKNFACHLHPIFELVPNTMLVLFRGSA